MITKEYIDRYNKLTLEYKQTFNESLDGALYVQDIDKLGFALEPTDKNYRYSKKFVSTKGAGNYGWHTSDNQGYIKTFYFDKFSKKMMPCKKRALFNKKDIIQHLTNNKIKKLKKSIKSTVYKFMYENKDNTRISFYNLSHTLGACLKYHNNIIWFDVDDHEAEFISNSRLNRLLEFLEIKLSDAIMIEQSQYNGGYHLCFKVPFTIKNNDFYKDLTKLLKDNDIDGVDVNFTQTVLRLPLSYEYNPLNVETLEPIKTFIDFHNSLNFDKIVNSKKLNKLYEPYQQKDMANEFCELMEETKEQKPHITMASVQKALKDRKNQYWKNDTIIIKPKEVKITQTLSLSNYEIHSGNRFEMQKILVPYCVNNLDYSLDQTIDFIYNHNVSSKDIKQFGKEGIKRQIYGYYNICKKNKEAGIYGCINNTNYQLNKFVDNEPNLPKDIADILNNQDFQLHITNQFKKLYIDIRKQYDKSYIMSEIKSHNIDLQFPYILKQVIGSFYYQITNIEDKKSRCIDKKYLPFIGCQISDIHLKRIINESKNINGVIGSNKQTSFQVQYLKKAIYQLLNPKYFNLVTNKSNCSRNYHKGFCTSFIPTIDNIFNFFIRQSKLLMGYRCFNNIFKKIKIYIISYISLMTNSLKKQELLKSINELAIKLGIDPPPKINFT